MLGSPWFWLGALLVLLLAAVVLRLLWYVCQDDPPNCPACGMEGVRVGTWGRGGDSYRCPRCHKWWSVDPPEK